MKSKRNELMTYVAMSRNTLVFVDINYKNRRKLKETKERLVEEYLGGKQRNFSWSGIAKRELEIGKGLLKELFNLADRVVVKQIKNPMDAVGKIFGYKENSETERVYLSELKFVQIAGTNNIDDIYFVRQGESIVTQAASIVAGIHGYTDIYFENRDSEGPFSPKHQLTELFLASKFNNLIYM